MARKKSAAKKNNASTKAPSSKKPKRAHPPERTLHQFLMGVKAGAKVAAPNIPRGACIVTDPHTGVSTCVFTDQVTCAGLKGKFMGGPCGG